MNFLELIRKRRSIRVFKDKEIEAAKMEILKEAVLRAPSSRSLNPWRFIWVTDRQVLESLAASKPHGAGFLNRATLGVVVLGDPEVSDVWIEDCSIAAIFLQLAAQDLGLGSCWVQIRNREYRGRETAQSYVRKILRIPENLQVEAIIGLGYPDEEREPVGQQELEYGKIFSERYFAKL